jgi:hypothetical protein
MQHPPVREPFVAPARDALRIFVRRGLLISVLLAARHLIKFKLRP